LNVLEMDPSHELAGKMLDALDSKLLGHEDDDFESHLREARVRVRRGQIDGANSLLVNLLDNYPDNALPITSSVIFTAWCKTSKAL